MLVIHGKIIKGSGLYEILKNNGLSIIGTSAVVNGNPIIQAKYCLQISVCAIYSKLKNAKKMEQSALMPLDYLEIKVALSQMCNYCYFILTL